MTMMDTDEGKTVMCLLTDPEGTHLGSAMYIPQKAGPLQLTQLVNRFLDNEEMLPYSFYVSDEELLVPVGTYLEKNKVSVEKVLTIVYQQQAVFRIRPVNRCSQTIAGNVTIHHVLFF
jgi:ribosome assembly protein 4